MTDYSALKVVDLKKVLKERGLLVSGNKADLIQRLQDADETKPEDEVEDEAKPESEDQETGQEVDEAGDNSEPRPVEPDNIGVKDNKSENNGPDAVELEAVESAHSSVANQIPENTDTKIAEPSSGTPMSDVEPTAPTTVAGEDVQKSGAQQDPQLTDVPLPHTETTAVSQMEPSSSELEAATGGISAAAAPQSSAQISSSPAEYESQLRLGQRRKRSHTPTPDESDIRKKLKAANGEGRVILPEDSEPVENTDDSMSKRPDANMEPEEVTRPIPDKEFDKQIPGAGIDVKSRQSIPGSPGEPSMELDQRPVARAKHKPTKVIYVRNLKRPLQPAALKAHLSRLAACESEDPDNLTGFWIDPIRTHCFARFGTEKGASLARDGLHDQFWPDDKQREALWADYIPEDKYDEFIRQESESKEQTRWQVDYEETEGGLRAVLSSRSHTEPRKDVRKDVRTDQEQKTETSRKPPRDDRAKGFGTLDDLFRSTTVKPILYFLPAEEDLVQSRLAEFRKGRGGGRGRGEARYTFQHGDKLVDDGQDTGLKLDRPRGFVSASNPQHVRGNRGRR